MAKVFIEETTLTAIGDAIREKTGKTDLIDPAVMHTEIASIEAGGGGVEPPESAFNATGNFNYRYAFDNWTWFLEQYGDKITTSNITNLAYAFSQSSSLKKIPFVLNIKGVNQFNNAFENLTQITESPKIRGTFPSSLTSINMVCLKNNYLVRDFSELFTPEMLEVFSNFVCTSQYMIWQAPKFEKCYSMRRVPEWFSKFTLSRASTAAPAYTSAIYNSLFNGCYALDEVKDLHVYTANAGHTSNMFGSSFVNLLHIKSFTFETEDGQPIEAKWKTQTIDLSGMIGYTNDKKDIINYNSGITADKEVKDDATYQALKSIV